MTYEFSFTYLACQSCTARIHCDQCRGELEERLVHAPGISGAEIDMENKRLRIAAQALDEDDLLDILEDKGIFAD